MKNKKAFTIIELVLSLVILALLMTAAAIAVECSVNSYTGNKDSYESVNAARQALNRITSDLRNASAVSTTSPSNECSFLDSAGKDITYRYDSSEGKLWLVTNYDLSDQDYLLCQSVTAMSFDKVIASKSGTDYVKYVKIKITVSQGQDSQSLAAAAVVRKNL